MDSAPRAALVVGRGLAGNANQGGKRQVTLLSLERWQELMSQLGADLGPGARRANIVLSGIALENSRGRVLRIGDCRLLVHGETRPCEQMEAALSGLQEAMRERWGGGAFAEVVEGGEIALGDEVSWESRSENSQQADPQLPTGT
jgi:MOSC domain-containing protein YiiM